jgi:hypothetical protein
VAEASTKRCWLHAKVVGLSRVQAASAAPSGEQLSAWKLPKHEVMMELAAL